MHKTQQLLIRACKSKDAYTRLHSVYRRFYLPVSESEANFHIAGLLTSLCDKYVKPNTASLVNDLNPDNWARIGVDDPEDYWQVVVRVMASRLRLAARSAYPGLTPPRMFRHQETQAA